MKKYAKVVVRSSSHKCDNNLFTYKIPEHLLGKLEVGHRVLVPFGIGNKPVEGFIFYITDVIDGDFRLKDVLEELDEDPIFSRIELDLICWIKNRYLCSYIDCINLIYPKGHSLNNYRVVYLRSEFLKEDFKLDKFLGKDGVTLKKDEIELIKKINEFGGNVNLEKLKKIKDVHNILRRLEKKEVLRIKWEYTDKKNEKNICYIKLNMRGSQLENYIKDKKFRVGKAQTKIIEFLQESDEIEINDLMNMLDVSRKSIKLLVEKSIVEFVFKPHYREPRLKYRVEKKEIVLNKEQRIAVDKVISSMNLKEKRPFMINGVTGSGKTEVYFEIIDEALKRGYSCVFLIPEISLTPQMISRLKNKFGEIVGVYHSKLSDGERHDVYKAIKRGKIKVLIGARSALFAPFIDLGVIIIDEFHESSYRSDQNPKYSAVEIARYMSLKHNLTLVLGSATPSVDEYYRALNGEYELIEIKNRANGKPMPKIEVIDMKEELDRGNISIFSGKMLNEIKKTISSGEQVILFLNRRGYANFISCKKCSYVFKCKNCEISLTYHKNVNKGICHYCGYEVDIPEKCPDCDSVYIQPFGTGTQKIEDELITYIPEAKILRMDKDTTTKKGSLERLLTKFKDKKANVLIGTQMLSKGLDFENVTLVGILSADMILNYPDFRSFETTYQLITQVAGRAGRSNKLGRVFLQSYDTDNYAIRYAVDYDYESFYNEEIKIRRAFGYTPFSNIMRIVVSGEDKNLVIKNIKNLYNSILYVLNGRNIKNHEFILGPSECSISKINKNYRWQLMFKDENVEINLLKGIIRYICITKRELVFDKNIMLSIDINPKNML